jgi:hypothetical protein
MFEVSKRCIWFFWDRTLSWWEIGHSKRRDPITERRSALSQNNEILVGMWFYCYIFSLLCLFIVTSFYYCFLIVTSFYCYFLLLLYIFIVMYFYCYIFLLLCPFIVISFYCYIFLFLYLFIVVFLLLYLFIVMYFYCYVFCYVFLLL